jgi:hypothetical protein
MMALLKARREMKRPLIASPPWTQEEEQQMRDRAVAGEHPAAIGKALGRSEGGVRHRMNKLGIPSSRRLKRTR